MKKGGKERGFIPLTDEYQFKENLMKLTVDLIKAGMTNGVGINRKQGKLLGVDIKKSGWLKSLIGKEISEEVYNTYVLLKGTAGAKKTFSIKEASEQIGVSYDVLKNATKRCYPAAIKNGKRTELTPGMLTVIIEDIKNNKTSMERQSFEVTSKVSKVTTSLTPALKIKQAMEMMQEAYEEELANLRAQNTQLEEFKTETELKLMTGDLVETPSENARIYLSQNIQRLGTAINSYSYAWTEFYRRIQRDMSINVKLCAANKGIKPMDYICNLPLETFNQIFAISKKMLREHNLEPIYR